MQIRLTVSTLGLAVILTSPLLAADGASGPLDIAVGTNGVKTVSWPRMLLPALETNRLATGSQVGALTEVPRDAIAIYTNGYVFGVSNQLPAQYFSLTLGQMPSNKLLVANLLNRITYGPTPDELVRVSAMGPQAFINEQLNPASLPNPLDDYDNVIQGIPVNVPHTTNWTTISVTGRVSGATSGKSPFYIYMTGAGDAYIDDVQLSVIYTNFTEMYVTNATNAAIITTNLVPSSFFLGPNLVSNGNFESPLTGPWVRSGAHIGSTIVGSPVASGSGSLHVIASAGTNSTGITHTNVNGLTNGHRCVLTFSYFPRASSDTNRVNIRLSGSEIIGSDGLPPLPPTTTWYYIEATGLATATPSLYLYLSGAGEAYVDDVRLVRGSVAGIGTNLLTRNPDFELPLTNNWQASPDFTNSVQSTQFAHSGNGSLRLIATAAGGGNNDSVFQSNIFGVTNNGTYTVSFWCTTPTAGRTLTVRLSGSLLVATFPGQLTAGGIKREMDKFATQPQDGTSDRYSVRNIGGVTLADMRSWYIVNSVGSPRQLLEVLTQFLENHFVTEHAKSYDYFDQFYDDGTLLDKLSTDWEYHEVSRWRTALMNTNCTFFDLLKIHAESPAEIVYLDTVNSRGNGNNIANENYGRELLELFCMGVDNGYDQLDITAVSRAWTGWSVDIVDPSQVNNPFAPQSRTYGFYPGNGTSGISNIVGVWSFVYRSANHGTNRAPILSEWAASASRTNLVWTGPKRYASRVGAPWAGQSYQIVIPARTGNAGIQDGYDVIQSLANNVHTAEYLSVKLCRLFVHDNFPNPTTTTNLAEYAYYNYTNPNRTPEAELVRQCIVAWQTPASDGRRGNIRSVLNTIFNSALFRSHGGSMQKVKTPVEYTVSAIRALRSSNGNGTYTASSDGYSISGRSRTASSSPLVRMGGMKLFDRDAPDGYPEDGPPWVSAGTLAERVRFIQTYLMPVGATGKGDGITGGNNNLSDPVTLLKNKLPPASWNNAGAVADYFLSILYPAEGTANLDLYRANAMYFLNRSDDGLGDSPFVGVTDPNSYDTRVRAMVSMLMTLHRFQEQ